MESLAVAVIFTIRGTSLCGLSIILSPTKYILLICGIVVVIKKSYKIFKLSHEWYSNPISAGYLQHYDIKSELSDPFYVSRTFIF